MARLHRIATAILTLDALLTASVALASPQSRPDLARSHPPAVPQTSADKPPGGRVVSRAEQLRWLGPIGLSGVTRFLGPLAWDGRGYRAQAIDVPALLEFLDGQLVGFGRGLFRRGFMHGLHKDVGPQRKDYRTDRNLLGDGSMQLVVSTVTGGVFIDMDAFSPYEDPWSFVGHSMEVLKNRFPVLRGRSGRTGDR